jgi:hypothetical protein
LRFRARQTDGERGALVWCEDCRFEWYGPTAAHGLSVLGSCSRCGGRLSFAADELPQPGEVAERELQPWQVLGAPTSWAGH